MVINEKSSWTLHKHLVWLTGITEYVNLLYCYLSLINPTYYRFTIIVKNQKNQIHSIYIKPFLYLTSWSFKLLPYDFASRGHCIDPLRDIAAANYSKVYQHLVQWVLISKNFGRNQVYPMSCLIFWEPYLYRMTSPENEESFHDQLIRMNWRNINSQYFYMDVEVFCLKW